MYTTLTKANSSNRAPVRAVQTVDTHTLTYEAFMQREEMLWGQEYVDRALEAGYIVVPSDNALGWTWAV